MHSRHSPRALLMYEMYGGCAEVSKSSWEGSNMKSPAAKRQNGGKKITCIFPLDSFTTESNRTI
jgi:hypothetical protein